jgi:hypothetical protein
MLSDIQSDSAKYAMDPELATHQQYGQSASFIPRSKSAPISDEQHHPSPPINM